MAGIVQLVSCGVAVIMIGTACGSEPATRSRDGNTPGATIAGGPIPNPPGPLRSGALIAPVGNSIVVFGGVPEDARGRGTPIEDGLILGPTGGWQPLTGKSGVQGGLVSAGAVDTGDELLILGTQCDEHYEAFYRKSPDVEDDVPCRGQPLRFLVVDPVAKSVQPLPAPETALIVDPQSVPSFSVHGVGWAKGRAVFNVGVSADTTTLVFDPSDQRWTALRDPNPDPEGPGPITTGAGRLVSLAGETIVAVETQESIGPTSRSGARAWRWDDDGSWVELDELELPADSAYPRAFVGFGAVGVLALRGSGRAASVFRIDSSTLKWERVPDTPPLIGSIADWSGRVGTSLVLWVGLENPNYLRITDGKQQWTVHPKPERYSADRNGPWETRVYADRALLLVPDTVGADARPMELRYLDAR